MLAAARELVATKGLYDVTMPEIARRAGVAATSLYRRWGDVGSLLLDMAVESLAYEWPLPNEGSIEGDLKVWGEQIAINLSSAEKPMFFRVLLAVSDVPREKRIAALAPRLEQLQAMLHRGRARGEKVPSVEGIIDFLLAPLYVRALLGLTVDKALAEQLVERLMRSSA